MPTSHLVVIQWWSCFLPWAYGIKNRQDGSLQWTSPSPQALKVTVSPKPMLGPWSVLIFREMLSLLASNPLESLLSPTVSEVFLERSCVDLFWVEELLLVKKSHHPMPPIHYPVTPSIVWFGDEGSLWREIWTPWWLLFFFFSPFQLTVLNSVEVGWTDKELNLTGLLVYLQTDCCLWRSHLVLAFSAVSLSHRGVLYTLSILKPKHNHFSYSVIFMCFI